MVSFDSKSKILTLQVKYVHPNQDVSFAQCATINLAGLPEPMLQFTVKLAKQMVTFALNSKAITAKRTSIKGDKREDLPSSWDDVGVSLKRAVESFSSGQQQLGVDQKSSSDEATSSM
jgi:hypothetical protein